MEWLETIKVRGGASGYQGADTELLKQLDAGMKIPGLIKVSIYANVSLPNDLMITLVWSKETPQARGSDIAHSLERELKQYGLVDHSVWIEKTAE
ncbi:MAG: hypothetical protein V2I97_25445 [Desulfococcaceae bacterium]|nr:hypothetical protein [Desulfococcaceae bacterium]